ncbi:DUF2383 domain-containing protein [Roseivivax isoporae]|uniref:DUF2383 domain-containing protein n=1 Tax=Roseivivax isoporae LMG 25204 TaxID=1449351 RepID=X7F8G9_9RHOB|nr:ferritin-like domain-containing protein [Roseivivax isoporae]ETX29003.1 hypothetical protein RISW2_03415 [Roseivivax isoporae LMG 25204]
MVTTVGTENSTEKLIENCILLEHDAIAAYETVIDRLESTEFRARLRDFRDDHLSHLDALKAIAGEHGVAVPESGDAKEMMTTGKIKLADFVGDDGTILRAMTTNEADTVSAYEHAVANDNLPAAMRPMVESALADERRHKDWMERNSTRG